MALLNVDYTQKKFWGGSYYSYWVVLVISVIFGAIGLDHLYLRSPLTFLMKAITNIFTFGLWYFYDIFQLVSEKESVLKHGLRAPLLGPLGVGAGMFREGESDGGPEAKSPYRFLGFILALFIPGMSYAFAGDLNGGMAQFASMLFPPLWLILIGWMIYNGYRTLFQTKSLFSEGMPRIFPWNWWLMDDEGKNYLGPKDVEPKTCAEDAGGVLGFFQRIITTVLNPVVGPLSETLLGPYGQAIKATGQTLATTATAAGEIVSKTAEGAKEIVDLAVDTGIPIAKTGIGMTSMVAQGPDILEGTKDQVLKNLEGYKNIGLIQKIADGKVSNPLDGSRIGTVSMVGGGLDDLPIAPFLGIVGIVIGAGAIAFLRYGKKPQAHTKGPDDKPPQPTTV